MGSHDDAVDETKLTLCCALCCCNCSTYPSCALCSGKVGCCCLNCEVCCKTGAPCLPCCCCGPTCDGDGCCNAQVQVCCAVISAAFPTNEVVPAAITILGCTIYPKCGPCMPMKTIMNRD